MARKSAQPLALQSDLASGKIIIASTKRGIGGDGGVDPSKTNPYGLVGGHAYFVEGIEQHGAKQFVKLGNPWGAAGDALVPCEDALCAKTSIDNRAISFFRPM